MKPRVAIVEGDGRDPGRWADGGEPTCFLAPRYGGNGELRRLEQALRAGSFERVVILTRWNGHPTTARVRRLCRRLGVAVTLVR